jgi:hypothetical protein
MSEQHDDLDLGAPPEPAPDPFAEIPADGGEETAEGTVGGDGATLEELEEAPLNAAEPAPGEFLEEPPEAEPEPEAPEPAPEPEAKPEPVETIENSVAVAEPEPQDEAKEQPVSSDAPEPAKAKKAGSSVRHYTVLKANPDTGEWSEPFKKEGGIEAANGEIAIREAYNRLVPEDSAEQIELVVFPTHYWKPRKVGAATKVRRSVTIE